MGSLLSLMRCKSDVMDISWISMQRSYARLRIIIGKQGSMLKKIGTQARIEMENLLDMKVNLQLWVKVKKDWRDSDMLLKNYGYDKKEV